MEPLEIKLVTPVSFTHGGKRLGAVYAPPGGFKYSYRDTIYFALMNSLRHHGAVMRYVLSFTYKYWREEKPKLIQDIEVTKRFAYLSVTVRPDTWGDKKWLWLNSGTSIRWALMGGYKRSGEIEDVYGHAYGSKYTNFFAKTAVSRGKLADFNSDHGPGGGPFVRGQMAMLLRNIAPRDGIEARRWSKSLLENMSRENAFKLSIQNAINKALGLKPKRASILTQAPYKPPSMRNWEEPGFEVWTHPIGNAEPRKHDITIFKGEITARMLDMMILKGVGLQKITKAKKKNPLDIG